MNKERSLVKTKDVKRQTKRENTGHRIFVCVAKSVEFSGIGDAVSLNLLDYRLYKSYIVVTDHLLGH